MLKTSGRRTLRFRSVVRSRFMAPIALLQVVGCAEEPSQIDPANEESDSDEVTVVDELGATTSRIHVIAGTYGANCGAASGNKTTFLSANCNGKESCDYVVDYRVIGDPAPGCGKTYTAQWTCDSDPTVHSLTVGAEAGVGNTVALTCGSPTGINVVGGTYGANCGAASGNKTSFLSANCNGKQSCDYIVDYRKIGDPAPGCGKTYTAQWTCGSDPTVRSVTVGAEAGFGRTASLSCPAPAPTPLQGLQFVTSFDDNSTQTAANRKLYETLADSRAKCLQSPNGIGVGRLGYVASSATPPWEVVASCSGNNISPGTTFITSFLDDSTNTAANIRLYELLSRARASCGHDPFSMALTADGTSYYGRASWLVTATCNAPAAAPSSTPSSSTSSAPAATAPSAPQCANETTSDNAYYGAGDTLSLSGTSCINGQVTANSDYYDYYTVSLPATPGSSRQYLVSSNNSNVTLNCFDGAQRIGNACSMAFAGSARTFRMVVTPSTAGSQSYKLTLTAQ